MKKTVLVCPPDYFQIEYEINPWMSTDNRVDPIKAREEFDALVALYESLGVTVEIIQPQKGLPDMVFAANHGFVIDDLFIAANFRYSERGHESKYAQEYFRKKGFRVETFPDDIYFEGQGDLFYADGIFIGGYGKRTSREAVPVLEKMLGAPIVSVHTDDPYYYHLDTCFAPLGNNRAIVKSSSFSKNDNIIIRDNFDTIIEVPDDKYALFASNVVVVDEHIVCGEGIAPSVKQALEALSYTICETPMYEFLKSGGAVKCLTLEYFQTS